MKPRWTGAAGALARAVEELVGSGRWWGRRGNAGRTPEPVVIELRGGTGAHALDLLKRLGKDSGGAPRNSPEAWGAHDPASLVALLDDLAMWYSYPGLCRRRRPIRFRRFRMARAAYDMWETGQPCNAESVQRLHAWCEQAAQREKGGLLHELRRLRGPHAGAEERPSFAVTLTSGIASFVVALTVVPLVEWLVRHYLVHRPARRWFMTKCDSVSVQAMYLALCEVRSEPTEVREQWLVDAFLADIDAYYHLVRRLNRSRLPLLLLPHVGPGTPSGLLLERMWAPQAGTAVPRHSSPVVVAHVPAIPFGDDEGGGEEGGPGEIVIYDTVVAAARAGTGREPAPFALPEPPYQAAEGVRLRLSSPGPVATSLSAATVLALVAVGLTVGPEVLGGVDCGQGPSFSPAMVEADGQCVGVTAGGAGGEFMPELTKVSRLIEEANARAERKPSTVTVAFMLPMTPDRREIPQVVREVQGAYLAQRYVNGPSGSTPDIRLVLANPGREYAHWEKATDELVGMTDDDRFPLRAVTGFNLSVDATERALKRLTGHGIPVVGGPITADELENVTVKGGKQRFPGMARTTPVNSAQAKALVRYFRRAQRDSLRNSILISDQRRGDSYNDSLAKAFRDAGLFDSKTRQFTSPGQNAEGDVEKQFSGMTTSICATDTENIFFAGRPAHLRLLLKVLADEGCGKGHDLRIFTGSGASGLALLMEEADWDRMREHPEVRLFYSAVGHDRMWRDGRFGKAKSFFTAERYTPEHGTSSPTPATVLREAKALAAADRHALGAPVHWDDSRAMSGFDSVWLAGKALQNLPPGTRHDTVPALGDLAAQWRNTFLGRGVPGTTGWLCLDNNGNPYNKTVAVVALDPGGRDEKPHVRFEAVAWPESDTPPRDCEVKAD